MWNRASWKGAFKRVAVKGLWHGGLKGSSRVLSRDIYIWVSDRFHDKAALRI